MNGIRGLLRLGGAPLRPPLWGCALYVAVPPYGAVPLVWGCALYGAVPFMWLCPLYGAVPLLCVFLKIQ